MITFSDKETVSSLMPDIVPLLHSHYKEIARHQNLIPLKPDFEKYLELEKLGRLHIVTARDNGSLVGYFICFINIHIHYRDHVMALSDLIYLTPDYRGGETGKEMIEHAQKGLTERGVMQLHMNVKLEHDFGSLLLRMGFTPIEIIYEKMLVEG